MPSLRSFVASRGGFARKRELVAIGATDRMLTAAVRTGVLTRARNGWYTTRPESDPAVRAVRLGGRLTGMSALLPLGVWCWRPDTVLRVAVRPTDARLRSPDDRRVRWRREAHPGVRLSWDDDPARSDGTAWSVGVVDALVRVVLDEPFEQAVMALDWAWRSGRVDLLDFERVIARLPAELRGIREWVDPKSRSPLESGSRVRLRRRGHHVVTAVRMSDGLREIDLVVDGVVGLETDGREFHESTFESDRRKDLAMTLEGLHAIRVSARMVHELWPSIADAIEIAVSRRLGPRSTRVAPPLPAVGNSGSKMFQRRRRCRGRLRVDPPS